MDRADLEGLLSLLRDHGVTYYESAGTKIVLGPARAAELPSLVSAKRPDETEDDRIDRLAFGKLFHAGRATNG